MRRKSKNIFKFKRKDRINAHAEKKAEAPKQLKIEQSQLKTQKLGGNPNFETIARQWHMPKTSRNLLMAQLP